MKIREAKINEIEKIAVLMEQVARIHYDGRPEIFKKNSIEIIRNNVIEILGNNEKTILVAIDDKLDLSGVLIYKIKEVKEHINVKDFKIIWIDEIVVDEKYRKMGTGKLLMKEVEKIAKIENCSRIELNCWSFNENAIKFYESIGMIKQRVVMEKEIDNE